MFRLWLGSEITGVHLKNRTARKFLRISEPASPWDSPLSVVKLYNINSEMSSNFMQFYVFHKGKTITTGKEHKVVSEGPFPLPVQGRRFSLRFRGKRGKMADK